VTKQTTKEMHFKSVIMVVIIIVSKLMLISIITDSNTFNGKKHYELYLNIWFTLQKDLYNINKFN
jgi:hypothetical protein